MSNFHNTLETVEEVLRAAFEKIYEYNYSVYDIAQLSTASFFTRNYLAEKLAVEDAQTISELDKIRDDWRKTGKEVLESIFRDATFDDWHKFRLISAELILYKYLSVEEFGKLQEKLDFLISKESIFEGLFGNIHRNDSCFCGSGKKFKKCCMPYIN
jgi:cytoplasmic iron level regulating protein YaaA (DUF328/UPF0246 family)